MPAGIDVSTFDRALQEFAAAVGKDWVFSDLDDVALNRGSYLILWGEPDERLTSAAVAP